MRIWKRILLFLAVFLLVLGTTCLPFREMLPSWLATLRGGWADRPYQIAEVGSDRMICAARVEKDGDLRLRFFDPTERKSLKKWDIPLPEEAAEGELCLLYPVGDECAFLGVYEENASYLSLYRLQKGGQAERLLREDCVGDTLGAKRLSRVFSSVARQQDKLYFTLLAEDVLRTYVYTQENGFVAEGELERGTSASAVSLSDGTFWGEDGELELTYSGNGLYYLDGKELVVRFADLTTETHTKELKLEETISDHQLTSVSLTQEGNALLLLDGHLLLLVSENGVQDLTEKLFLSRGDCIVRVGALLAEALIVSLFVCWILVGQSRGRLPLAVYWGIVSLALFLAAGLIMLGLYAPVKEYTELMQKFELTDDIVDLALAEHQMTDERLPKMIYNALEETNSISIRGLKVVPVHQENEKWYLTSGLRSEADSGSYLACMESAANGDGIAAMRLADRFWYVMTRGENGIYVSYQWGEFNEPALLKGVVVVGLCALAAATVMVLFLVGHDVKRISRGLEHYAADQEWERVRVSGGDELEGMASTLNSLAADRRDEERKRQRIIKSYRRFVPEEILALLGKSSVLDVDQNTIASRRMAVMRVTFRFADPVYTNSGNIRLMFESVNEVIERTAPIVRQKGGVVFNFAYNGYDVVMEQDSRQVISTAVAVRQEVLALNEQRAQNALPTVILRIAIDEGGVILGIVGDQAQLEPSAVSDSWSTLFELLDVCNRTESNILCTEAFFAGVEGYSSRYVGRCAIGHRSSRVYEVFDGDPYEVRKAKEAGLRQFSEGVLSLYSGDVAHAKRVFLDLVRDTPQDGCARYYLYLSDKLTMDEVLGGLTLNGGRGHDWSADE